MVEVRFKKKMEIIDVLITAIALVFSVGTMLYGVWHLGLKETWPELVLNLFYIDCLVIAALYTYDIFHEPSSKYTSYLLTEIWIRPTITYGLVACFVAETKENQS